MKQEDFAVVDKWRTTISSFPSYRCDKSDIIKTLRTIDSSKKSLLTVSYKDVEFDFLICMSHVSTTRKTVVFGSGALPRNVDSGDAYMKLLKIPYFSRLSWDVCVPYNTIWYSDASKKYYAYKNKEVSLGWNIGNSEHWFLETIKDILQTFFKFYSIQTDDVLFYGSSGGGFQSIVLGTLFRSNKVFVDCPQFDCTQHNCFNALLTSEETISDICDNQPYRYNAVACFEKFGFVPRITINESFSRGDANQLILFIRNIQEGLGSGCTIYDVPVGTIGINFINKNTHTYLTKEEFIECAKNILQ